MKISATSPRCETYWGEWDRKSVQCPVPPGLWAVETADDGWLLGGATLLPFSPRDPRLVMGRHLRPQVRGRGVAVQIGHALAHQAFLDRDVDEVFVATPAQNASSLNVAKRLGMTRVDDFDWATPVTRKGSTTGECDDPSRPPVGRARTSGYGYV